MEDLLKEIRRNNKVFIDKDEEAAREAVRRKIEATILEALDIQTSQGYELESAAKMAADDVMTYFDVEERDE